jgi:hypothetical protein
MNVLSITDPYVLNTAPPQICCWSILRSESYLSSDFICPYLQIKGGKYKPDAAIAQAKMLLSGDTRDRVIGAMDKCRGAADGIDGA